MADLGTDFAGITDIDANLSQVSGRTGLGQAILRRWLTAAGELFYDPEYGAGLRRILNASIGPGDADRVAYRLEQEALRDERVEDLSVVVNHVEASDLLEIRATITDAEGPFVLTVELSTLVSTSANPQPAVKAFQVEEIV